MLHTFGVQVARDKPGMSPRPPSGKNRQAAPCGELDVCEPRLSPATSFNCPFESGLGLGYCHDIALCW